MTVIEHATTVAPRCVRVEPVGASLRETGYAATPELAVWVDQGSGRTWLAMRFGRVLLEVELEPGQVDTVTAGLLDEVPVPYELPLNGAAPAVWSDDAAPGGMVCGARSSRREDDICGMPVESEPCPEHGYGDIIEPVPADAAWPAPGPTGAGDPR